MLILALSLAAKRRPADLVEIVAAAELAHGAIPSETKLSDAFARLSAYGLICEQEGGYTLSEDAQQMVAKLRKKAEARERIFDVKESLADYRLNGEHQMVQVSPEQLLAAIQAHKKSRSSERSWLIEKPKPVWISKKELVRGKSLPARRRKS
jgi:DNA-binding PadR family transcriptional regulator